VKLLLDTHVALWSLLGDARMGDSMREMIQARDNPIFVSAASIWEIAIKYPLAQAGRGKMPVSAPFALDHCDRAGFTILAVTGAHATAVEHLPPIHGDPFDRLLIAQAAHESMRLLTHDAMLARYGETVIHL
jgi:PIN domain nuclease of toxin-antitoxin system